MQYSGAQIKRAGFEGLTENHSAMFGCSSTSRMNSPALLEWFRNAQRFFTCTLCAHITPRSCPPPPGTLRKAARLHGKASA